MISPAFLPRLYTPSPKCLHDALNHTAQKMEHLGGSEWVGHERLLPSIGAGMISTASLQRIEHPPPNVSMKHRIIQHKRWSIWGRVGVGVRLKTEHRILNTDRYRDSGKHTY
jgi:hypothetical protein